jgi:hypothetical protein
VNTIAFEKREYRVVYQRAPLRLCHRIPGNMHQRRSPAYRKASPYDSRDVVTYTCIAACIYPFNAVTHYLVLTLCRPPQTALRLNEMIGYH